MDNCHNAFWEYSNEDRFDALLDGGAHMDDNIQAQRRQYRHDTDKPCNKILAEVVKMGYERPDYSRDRLAAEKDN
jgi:hypothetical protein